MPRFLIDVNLPSRLSLWKGNNYIHVRDLNDEWKDPKIWDYARRHNLVIVSKDTDFSDLVMLSTPPPRVVHIRLGKMKIREFRTCLLRHWPWIVKNIHRFKLIRVFADRLETVADEDE